MSDLPIVRPTHPPLDAFSFRFNHALKTGQVTNGGEYVEQFEAALRHELGVPTLAFSSGQAALMTMLAAAGIVEGDEVICPAFTFVATPAAIAWAGGLPVFADIDPRTLSLDPRDVRRRISPRTKAILAVDPYGICCEYNALTTLAHEHGIKLLIDSAAAFGSTYQSQQTGGFGDAQIFSFHATKAFSTMEGGALCSRYPLIIERAAQIRNFGQDDEGGCAIPGINGKMMEVCALVGLEQLEGWSETRTRRKSNAALLHHELTRAAVPGVSIPRAPAGVDPIWLYRPIVISAPIFGKTRDEVAAGMQDRGVMVRKYYSPPCHWMRAFQPSHALPATEITSLGVLALPVYNDMTMAEATRIADTLKEVQCA